MNSPQGNEKESRDWGMLGAMTLVGVGFLVTMVLIAVSTFNWTYQVAVAHQ